MLRSVREGSFVVCGLGTFGANCARALYRSGAIVLAIDNDEKVVDQISPFVTVAVRADVLDEAALQEVGAFDMTTAIVALRRHFDTSVLLTHMLKSRKVSEVLVQVDSHREASAIRAVGATEVIFPERDMAAQIARRLVNPGLADQVPLDENFAIIDVECPPSFAGQTLQELELRQRYNVTVVALKQIQPGSDKITFLPAPPPDKPLQNLDHLILLGDRKNLFRFKQQLGLS